MTAGGEHAGLHKRWLERKLEIEVGKVQAKLLSKGLNVPVPDPEALETEARLAQAHLPKLCIDLYGRNPNGTLKVLPDANKRNGLQQHATVVQKLDRILNPALLTPIPVDVALAHGLPLSCCDAGELPASGGMIARGGGTAGPGGPRATTSHGKPSVHGNLAVGGSGGNAVAAIDNVGSPRYSRSPPQQSHCRPDLQAADLRIDDAVAEVHRVALQANEMSPRERVLYLARQANPHFSLPQPRSVHLHAMSCAPSRRDILKKGISKRVTSFVPDPAADGGVPACRSHKMQAGASRRSLACVENRRSPEALPVRSCSPTGGLTGEGSLPPLGTRSGPVSRVGSGLDSTASPVEIGGSTAVTAGVSSGTASAAVDQTAVAASRFEVSEATEMLPRLSPASPVLPTHQSADVGDVHCGVPSPPLPKLPSVHVVNGAEAALGLMRSSLSQTKQDSLINLWGAAAAVHAAEMEAARLAAEAEALAEAEAEALAEAEAAALEAEAEAAEAQGKMALEAEVEAQAQAAGSLLAKEASTGGAAMRRSGDHEHPSGAGDSAGHRPSGSQGEPHYTGHQNKGPGWLY